MAERLSLEQFSDLCGGGVNGYGFHEGQKLPESFEELTAFIADRVGVSEEEFSVHGLAMWLLKSKAEPDSCSPEIDIENVEAVLLMDDLANADAFVASLPDTGDGVWLPSPDVVRAMIAEQTYDDTR